MVPQSDVRDPELVTEKLGLLNRRHHRDCDGAVDSAAAHIGRLTAEDILRSVPCINSQASKMNPI